MAATKLALHVPPDANPSNVSEMLLLLAAELRRFDSVRDLLTFTESQGIGSRTEMQSIATDMGLLDKTNSGIGLSDSGLAFSNVREDARADILHFLMYTGWQHNHPLEHLPSWAYRYCCDKYWDLDNVTLDTDYSDRLVEEVINFARAKFMSLGTESFDEISFSRKSLSGAKRWLDAVQPSVIEGNTFSRRSFCPPELMMLALGYSVQDESDVAESDVLLSRDRRELICRACLLEPNALDKTLDWAISVFPHLVEPGTSAGTYGRFVRLHKLPTLQDLAR